MKKNGFTLVEILIALALTAIFVPAIGIIFSLSLQTASQGEKFTQAYALAQEGMEDVFKQKATDPAWDWTATSDTTVTIPNTEFSRRTEVIQSNRCGADFHLCLCPGSDPGCPGIADNDSRQIVITVSWPEKDQNQEVKLEAYVTKH